MRFIFTHACLVLLSSLAAFAAPTVKTFPPTNIAYNSATLNGWVDTKGEGTNIQVQFGTTTAYELGEIYVTYSSSLTPTDVAVTRGFLTRHQTYNYRVRAQVGGISYFGTNQKFIANDFPVAVADSATLLPSTIVTLNVIANDTDGDSDALSLASFVAPPTSQGKVTKVGNALTFVAAPTFTGTTISYDVADAFGGRATGTATLSLGACALSPVASANVTPTAQTITISVTTTHPWVVTESLPWVTASPLAGTGNGSVVLSLQANTSTTARFGDVFIGGTAHHIVQQSSLAPTSPGPVSVPDAIIGGDYSLVVPVTAQATPYLVTGLPKGLTMNTATRTIEGKPIEVGADKGTAHVTVKGAVETTAFDILVRPLPALAQGNFTAIIERDIDVTGDLGGFLSINVTPTADVTGTLRVGQLTPAPTAPGGSKPETKSYPIKAKLNVPLSGNPAMQPFIITRPGMPPLKLNLSSFDITAPDTGALTGTLELDGMAVTTPIEGRRLAWTTDTAAPYAADYTAALSLPALVPGSPEGSSYLLATVAAKTAVATWSGVLADGTSFTGSSTLWDSGAGTAVLPLWITLYSSQGALSAQPVITPQTLPDLSTLLGTVSWRKKPQSAARAYAAGFDDELDVLGTRYLPPAKGSVIFDLAPPNNDNPYNAAISFTDGGIEAVAQYDWLSQLFAISAANVATFLPVAENPALVKITKIDTKKGTFTGSFKLTDANLLPAPAPATIQREVKFSGVLLPGASPAVAIGHFLLPARPAIAGQTVSNTALTSGTVSF